MRTNLRQHPLKGEVRRDLICRIDLTISNVGQQ